MKVALFDTYMAFPLDTPRELSRAPDVQVNFTKSLKPEHLDIEQVKIVAKRVPSHRTREQVLRIITPLERDKPVETSVKVKKTRKPKRLNLQKFQKGPQLGYRWQTIAKIGVLALGIASAVILPQMLQERNPVNTGSGLMLSSGPNWANPVPTDNVWRLFQKPIWAKYSADDYQNTLSGNELQLYRAIDWGKGICEKQEVCSINAALVIGAPPVTKLDLKSFLIKSDSNPQKPFSFDRQVNWLNLTFPVENVEGSHEITAGHGPGDDPDFGPMGDAIRESLPATLGQPYGGTCRPFPHHFFRHPPEIGALVQEGRAPDQEHAATAVDVYRKLISHPMCKPASELQVYPDIFARAGTCLKQPQTDLKIGSLLMPVNDRKGVVASSEEHRLELLHTLVGSASEYAHIAWDATAYALVATTTFAAEQGKKTVWFLAKKGYKLGKSTGEFAARHTLGALDATATFAADQSKKAVSFTSMKANEAWNAASTYVSVESQKALDATTAYVTERSQKALSFAAKKTNKFWEAASTYVAGKSQRALDASIAFAAEQKQKAWEAAIAFISDKNVQSAFVTGVNSGINYKNQVNPNFKTADLTGIFVAEQTNKTYHAAAKALKTHGPALIDSIAHFAQNLLERISQLFTKSSVVEKPKAELLQITDGYEKIAFYSSPDQDCDFGRAQVPRFLDLKPPHISNIGNLQRLTVAQLLDLSRLPNRNFQPVDALQVVPIKQPKCKPATQVQVYRSLVPENAVCLKPSMTMMPEPSPVLEEEQSNTVGISIENAQVFSSTTESPIAKIAQITSGQSLSHEEVKQEVVETAKWVSSVSGMVFAGLAAVITAAFCAKGVNQQGYVNVESEESSTSGHDYNLRQRKRFNYADYDKTGEKVYN